MCSPTAHPTVRSTPLGAHDRVRVPIRRPSPTVHPAVLWYHAPYVAPSWGRRLSRATQVGTHIFYKA